MVTVIILLVFAVVLLLRAVRMVPPQNAYVVERLGKYSRTLHAGLHIVLPFIESIRHKYNLKEIALDVPEQICITKDNAQMGIDGILFFRVTDPAKVFYGVPSYVPAITQLAQTMLRSEIGKINLDRIFEEREYINNQVCMAVNKASDPWGVKALRYEIKSITPQSPSNSSLLSLESSENASERMSLSS